MSKIQPIFIGGCGRSGTTLLGSCLGTSENVVVTPESDFILRYLRYSDNLSLPKNFAEFLKNDWRYKQWDSKIPAELQDSIIDSVGKLGDNILNLVYNYALEERKSKANFWVDHSPKNIREAYLLLNMFEEAKFIHVVRDPRGVFASVRKLDWGPNTALKSAEWWCENVAAGLALERANPEKVLMIRYEDLVTEPETELRRVCKFCGIPYKTEMLLGNGFSVPDYTRKQHNLVGKKIESSRAEAWKEVLTEDDKSIIEARTNVLLQSLQYKLTNRIPGNIDWKIKVVTFIKEIVYLFPNWVLKWIRQNG